MYWVSAKASEIHWLKLQWKLAAMVVHRAEQSMSWRQKLPAKLRMVAGERYQVAEGNADAWQERCPPVAGKAAVMAVSGGTVQGGVLMAGGVGAVAAYTQQL